MTHQRDEDGNDHRTPAALTTARLVLRRQCITDRPAIEALATDPHQVDEMLPRDPGATTDGVIFVVLSAASGELLGQAGYRGIAEIPAPVELMLWLRPEKRGNGFGTEAAHAMIDHAFADGRVGVLWCAVRVTNSGARRVLEKSGFQFRGGGMLRPSSASGAFAFERFVLDRRNWASLKAWGADDHRRATDAA